MLLKICCNKAKLRETPKVLTTTLYEKSYKGTRLIAEPNGKNVKKWTIRSQASNSAMIGQEEGSTTKWFWV